MSTSYTKKDAGKDTSVDDKHVSGAWHNARNDSVGDKRYQGRSSKKESANAEENYYTGKSWNPYTKEWE